ncbi:putative serine protease F56F10.1 [Haliotis cracherodii]|uniref:putative serine protease F56F10.1 n=1 Tax=Haliotis cracherodii TaxID=6455 RepID=UPI0039EBBE05
MRMKTFLVCLVVATCLLVEADGFLGSPSQDDPPSTYPEHWFHQKLDHFNVVDTRYWKQRYYINDKFYRPGGPVFLFIGPQTELTPAVFTGNGAWLDYAKTYHAIGFAVEQRFYGSSHPTPDLSVDNLQYLSVEQSLEDLATFIVATNKERNVTNAKWISFGGSYSGMMSTWLRYKFPHLVTGAVADSPPLAAPVFAKEYSIAIGEDLRTESGCYEATSAIFDDIRASLKTNAGVKKLQSLFRLCDFNASNKLDVENMMMYLRDLIGWSAMFNTDANVMSPVPIRYVSSVCKVLTDKTIGMPLERLAHFGEVIYHNYTSMNGQCRNMTFEARLNLGRDVKYGNSNVLSARQWMYQKCTLMGLFTPSSGSNQPFGEAVSEEYFLKICEGYFGPSFNRSLIMKGHDELITNYGGLDIKVTNIIHTQGSFDPWTKYGFTQDPHPEAYVILINGGGHTPDMAAPSSVESAEVTLARAKIQRLIGQWIASGPTVSIVG